MKIIPLQTSDLSSILISGKNYSDLYNTFEDAFHVEEAPFEWYINYISGRLGENEY